jgi:hypothetical protein
VTAVVLVHDSACGLCSHTARRLAGILAVDVRLRSCRDPHLADEYAVLRPYLTGGTCRRPLVLVTYDDGRADVAGGLRMAARLAPLVRSGRWPAAAGLSARVLMARLGRVRRPGRS